MKKNTVLSAIAILLCFLIGYAAFQTADLIRTWIVETVSDCKSPRTPGCSENPDSPSVEYRRR